MIHFVSAHDDFVASAKRHASSKNVYMALLSANFLFRIPVRWRVHLNTNSPWWVSTPCRDGYYERQQAIKRLKDAVAERPHLYQRRFKV
jgi:hypothetical protein